MAVDDWVPGVGSNSAFSQIDADQAFWPLILEKNYAKIHGDYDNIEGGFVLNSSFYSFNIYYFVYSKQEFGQG